MMDEIKVQFDALFDLVESFIKDKTKNIAWTFGREVVNLDGQLRCTAVTWVNDRIYSTVTSTPSLSAARENDPAVLADIVYTLTMQELMYICFTND